MKKEEKELLISDLCARLPYKHYIRFETYNHYSAYKVKLNYGLINDLIKGTLIKIVPYLRPLSSMTEEEREGFNKVGGVMSYNPQNDTWAISAFTPEAYDWLNSHHFDYRGLIPRGLALEAPERMYKTE